jgi:hypothetical protein
MAGEKKWYIIILLRVIRRTRQLKIDIKAYRLTLM